MEINRGKVTCAFSPEKRHIIEDGIEKGREDFLLELRNSEEELLNKFGIGSNVAYIGLNELK